MWTSADICNSFEGRGRLEPVVFPAVGSWRPSLWNAMLRCRRPKGPQSAFMNRLDKALICLPFTQDVISRHLIAARVSLCIKFAFSIPHPTGFIFQESFFKNREHVQPLLPIYMMGSSQCRPFDSSHHQCGSTLHADTYNSKSQFRLRDRRNPGTAAELPVCGPVCRGRILQLSRFPDSRDPCVMRQ